MGGYLDVVVPDVQEVRRGEGGQERREALLLVAVGSDPPPSPVGVEARHFDAYPVGVDEDCEEDAIPCNPCGERSEGPSMPHEWVADMAVSWTEPLEDLQVVGHFVLGNQWAVEG